MQTVRRRGLARFFGYHALWIAFTLVAALPLFGLRRLLLVPSGDDDLVLVTLAGTAAAAWVTKLMMQWFEKRPFADVGLRWNREGRWHLALGLTAGFACAVSAALIPVVLGYGTFRVSPDAKADLRNFVFYLVIFSFQPLGEELAMRGYPFQMLIRKFGFPIALVVTSALFGAMHIGNQNSSNFGTFATFVIGVALGCAARKSGGLWLPTGIHTGWNIALPFLGVNLSGWSMRMTRFEVQGCTDALWCGGAYGVEAGLPTILVTALLLLGIWYAPVSAPSWFEPEKAALCPPADFIGEPAEQEIDPRT